MKPPQKAQIHLNEQRGKHELDWFRSFHTFNFGNYHSEHRHPTGDLYVLNDDTLAAGKVFTVRAEENTHVLLLPVVGAVSCNEIVVVPGELLALKVPAGTDLTIANPYVKENELVNFLQFWFTTKEVLTGFCSIIQPFRFENNMGSLIDITPGETYPSIHIGKYMGRQKDVYELKDPSKNIYAFVIQGAFEVEDRLLHARDGLALVNYSSVEFEALSNESILLMIGYFSSPQRHGG